MTLDPKGNCTGIVGPEYIGVASDLPKVTIVWKLQTAGWAFAPGTGIEFKGANKPTAAKVFKTNRTRSPDEWEEFDDNSDPGPFQYSINLKSGPKRTRDPIISRHGTADPRGKSHSPRLRILSACASVRPRGLSREFGGSPDAARNRR